MSKSSHHVETFVLHTVSSLSRIQEKLRYFAVCLIAYRRHFHPRLIIKLVKSESQLVVVANVQLAVAFGSQR